MVDVFMGSNLQNKQFDHQMGAPEWLKKGKKKKGLNIPNETRKEFFIFFSLL